jgi:hypothetical protein
MERIELRGGGGEPVDFARTLLSHGVAELPPNVVAPDGSALESVLPGAGKAWVVRVVADGPGWAKMEVGGVAPVDELAGAIRHMLRLDHDLPVLRPRGGGPAAGLGGRRRRAHAAQSDRVPGRRQDDLHDQLHVGGDAADGRRAGGRARHARRGRLTAHWATTHTIAHPARPASPGRDSAASSSTAIPRTP